MRLRYRILAKIRGWVYRKGYRPKPGSVLYSPSRALILAVEEAQASVRAHKYGEVPRDDHNQE